jgi:hypothetical protein
MQDTGICAAFLLSRFTSTLREGYHAALLRFWRPLGASTYCSSTHTGCLLHQGRAKPRHTKCDVIFRPLVYTTKADGGRTTTTNLWTLTPCRPWRYAYRRTQLGEHITIPSFRDPEFNDAHVICEKPKFHIVKFSAKMTQSDPHAKPHESTRDCRIGLCLGKGLEEGLGYSMLIFVRETCLTGAMLFAVKCDLQVSFSPMHPGQQRGGIVASVGAGAKIWTEAKQYSTPSTVSGSPQCRGGESVMP